MFRLILFISLVFSLTSLIAQQTITIPAANKQIIQVDAEWANIVLQPSKDQQVKIEYIVNIGNGTQNDFFEITHHSEGDKLQIESTVKNREDILYRKVVRDDDGEIISSEYVKRSKKGNYFTDNGNYSTSYEQSIDVELIIQVPTNKQIMVESVYGNVTANNLSGKLMIDNTYGSIEVKSNGKQSLDLTSTYSFVDVALPSQSKVDIEMNSGYGNFYTDLDMNIHDSHSEKKLRGSLNGGGEQILLSSQYQNIYLRKG